MNTLALLETDLIEIRNLEKDFYVNDQVYDLILKRSGEIFSVLVKDTSGKIIFHEQEIAEQLGINKP